VNRPSLKRLPARPFKRGFTLIELLVAISIAAVLVATVGFAIGSTDRGLETDSERLALMLGLAREEAQLRGSPIRFESDEIGYRFTIFKEGRWEPLLDDRDLRDREWGDPTELELNRLDGRETIVFGRDMVDSPFELNLTRGDQQLTIFANGLGAFELRYE